MLTCIIRKS